MLRKGLAACFSDSTLYRIAGEADNIENAKKVISSYKPLQETGENPAESGESANPAVAIVDVGFSSNAKTSETIQGFELVKFINQSGKNIKSVMFSSYTGQAYIRNALSAEVGAIGYVSKASESKVLIEAVNAAAKGCSFIDPYLSSVLVTTNNVYDLLSKREREVLKFVQQDLPNTQIAGQLNITERTVENHLSAIYAKTNTINKTELINMFGQL